MATPTSYQRVTTATDYDITAYQIHLKFDGIDDSLVTNNIDFTATDKMTVCAGVRKLSDAANRVIAELSATSATNTGTFLVNISGVAGSEGDAFYRVNGTAAADGSYAASLAAPASYIQTLEGDIAGATLTSEVKGRYNGQPITLTVANPGPAGKGNFGKYPLYIGSRAGTTLRFNGHIYSLIVRGAQSSDSQIASVERYVNGKIKAYA